MAAKLRALVATGWERDDAEPLNEATFPGGAAASRGDRGWVLAQDRPHRALGPALVWGDHARVRELHVLADSAAGLLARRAAAFRQPPSVWRVEGGQAVAAAVEPSGVATALEPAVSEFVPLLIDAGAEPVVEDGVLRGEVLGLEVARVVVDSRGAHLEIGVGHHDREMQRMLHGDAPSVEALRGAVQAVLRLRRAGAPSHPMNQLARERWLRAVVVARPAMAGAAELAPVAATMRPVDLRQPAPAAAVGIDADGRAVVVVCSTGIDLDLVPAAADARLAAGRPDDRLVLVVPGPDAHPVTRSLAARLVHPAEVHTVPVDWE